MVRKSKKRRMAEFLIITLVVYIFTTGLLYFFQRKLIYFPPSVPIEQMTGLLTGYEPVRVLTEDGLKLTGFFTAPVDPGKPIIIAFHGNASHPAWMAPFFSDMVQAGYGVLLAEYRGYGGNSGHPTEDGLYKDAEAFFQSDVLNKYRATNPIIIYGQSLGSGVAVNLAQKHNAEIRALILEVPFENLLAVVAMHYPFVPFKSVLLKDQFKSDLKIADVKAPKLFILAGKDRVVGYKTGRALFDLSPEPKQMVEYKEADHNTVEMYEASKAVQNFIEGILHEK